jgi:hypothetical protein
MSYLRYIPDRIHPAVYVIIAAVTFLVVLVWQAPAALVPQLVPEGGPVSLRSPSGTLWRGRAELSPVGSLSWSLNALPLAWFKVDIDWILDGDGLLLAGNLSTRGRDLQIEKVKGEVGRTAINTLLGPYGMSVEGDLRLAGIAARIADGAISDASGQAFWEGGTVNYQLGGKSFKTAMPALGGVLRMEEEGPTLDVSLAESDVHLMQVTLNPAGWAELKLTKRFLELAGFPWQGAQGPETYVLVVQEKLF